MKNFFQIDQREKVSVFIEAAAIHSAAKSFQGQRVDYSKLFAFLYCQERPHEDPLHYIQNIHFFASQDPVGKERLDTESRGIKPLLDWLSYRGVQVTTKFPVTHTLRGGTLYDYIDFKVEMTLAALAAAEESNHLIFFVGSTDYRYLFARLRQRNRRVTLVSTLGKDFKGAISGSGEPQVSPELRRSVNNFIDLGIMINDVATVREVEDAV